MVKVLRAEEISVGPYVLTDGEVPMTVVSAVSRLVPGVIKLNSLAEESHWNQLIKGRKGIKREKKETCPECSRGVGISTLYSAEVLEYKGKKYRVPKILLSGDHKKLKSGENLKLKVTFSPHFVRWCLYGINKVS